MKKRPLPKQFDLLAAEVEGRLRQVLRQHRRKLEGPTMEEAQDEETKLKELQPKLEEQERILKAQPPNEEGTKKFEEELKTRQKALHDFEDKLDQLQGFPFPPDGFDKLVQSFEDLLRDQETLLESFEDLLKRFQPCPIALLSSFEELLKDLVELLLSFMHLASNVAFGSVFSASFEDLLRVLIKLLRSFEDLIKRNDPKNKLLIASFSELVGGAIGRPLRDLLNGFAMLFMGSDPVLIASFADLLNRYAALLGSFEDIIKGTAQKPDPGLIGAFEARLRDFQDLLLTLENAIKKLAPPNRPLTEQFEGLLRSLCALLDSLEDLVKRNPTPPLITSFEDTLHGLVELLKSFEDMVRAIPEAPLTEPDRPRTTSCASFAKLVDEASGHSRSPKAWPTWFQHQDLLTSLGAQSASRPSARGAAPQQREGNRRGARSPARTVEGRRAVRAGRHDLRRFPGPLRDHPPGTHRPSPRVAYGEPEGGDRLSRADRNPRHSPRKCRTRRPQGEATFAIPWRRDRRSALATRTACCAVEARPVRAYVPLALAIRCR
jgi:hypothetical protein